MQDNADFIDFASQVSHAANIIHESIHVNNIEGFTAFSALSCVLMTVIEKNGGSDKILSKLSDLITEIVKEINLNTNRKK